MFRISTFQDFSEYENLRHLGLGFNCIKDISFMTDLIKAEIQRQLEIERERKKLKKFSNQAHKFIITSKQYYTSLWSIDLSFNLLTDLKETVNNLALLTQLKIVCLKV